jgi:DNA-directed RNA polymerase specialized sigma24 family protein
MAQDKHDWSSELRDAEQYRRLREKLITYFSRRGRSDAEDLADETIMRGWKRLAEGATLTAPLGAFLYGIARNVLREKIGEENRLDQLDEQTPTPLSRANPFADLWQKEVDQCVGQCWQALKQEERETYINFHKKRDTAAERDREREEFARQLGLSPNGLRNRVFWIRKKLIECARGCLGKKLVKQIPR